MAFHVACPITCKRICFCTLGFPERLQREGKRSEFLEEVLRVEEFLSHPVSVRVGGKTAVQVLVPRIAPLPIDGGDGGGIAGDREEILSAQTKRAALQRRAVAASLAAEDYARRFEAGNLADVSGEIVGELAGEEQGSSVVKVMCRICYSGENEGSDRAMRMLSCKTCGKKYHKNCLKSWAEHRDLFHWSSWACPSCRICEVCRRAGDPNKFMFCKRCDGAYHCYCQQPPHKNISHGPFLCPKHTRCHSCGSTVSGSGLSTRWFLGYTCCDACGRLFVKGKYCPVCLKVYRDSESTPMVCCDDCERWVHCECDGISDEMYQLFQADGNLYYKCTACRGDCYQVRDLADAVQELWRRRDKADKDQIASLRAAAGLPSQEEIFCSSPYSDDEENGPVIVKNDHSRSLKLSVKGLVEKATKNTDDHGKKSSKSLYPKKKNSKMKGYRVSLVGKTEEPHRPFERIQEARALENNLATERDDIQSYRNEGPVFVSPSNKKDKPHISPVRNEDKGHKVVQIKSTGKHASKIDAVKGTKLVIHLGARNKTATNSPRSEASSCEREQDLATTNGSEDSGQIMLNERRRMPETQDGTSQLDQGKGVKLNSELQLKSSKHRGRQKDLIKLGKGTSEASDLIHNNGRGNANKELENTPEGKTSVISISKATIKNNDTAQWKLSKGPSITLCRENHDNSPSELVSDSPPKDPKPLLKLKFKNPYLENRSLWPLHGEDERTSVKGQRSKRKRPSPSMEKAPVKEEDIDEGNLQRDRPVEEVMDANWILKKLGKDAIGKRVEVHQSSDNSWHKGVITDMINGTSALVVSLDDGRSKTLELGKQGVRFISQKQKRTRTVLL